MNFGISRRDGGEGQLIASLRKDVGEWESKIKSLKDRQDATSRQLELLEHDRREKLLPALADEDGHAQSELARIQDAIDRGRVRHGDLRLAMEDAERRLDLLRQKLAAAERESLLVTLEALLRQRPEKAEPVQAAMQQLIIACQAADELDNEIDGYFEKLGLAEPGRQRIRNVSQLCTYKYIQYQYNRKFGLEQLGAHYTGAHRDNLTQMLRRSFGGWIESIKASRTHGSDNVESGSDIARKD